MTKRKPAKIVWRPKKAIIELETKSSKRRYLSIHHPMVKEVDFTKNPEGITLYSIPHVLTAKVYANDPETVVIYFNDDVWRVNAVRTSELIGLWSRISWYLGSFGKTSQFGKRTRRKLSIVTILSSKREMKKRYGEPEKCHIKNVETVTT